MTGSKSHIFPLEISFFLFHFWCPERQKLFSFTFPFLFSERGPHEGISIFEMCIYLPNVCISNSNPIFQNSCYSLSYFHNHRPTRQNHANPPILKSPLSSSSLPQSKNTNEGRGPGHSDNVWQVIPPDIDTFGWWVWTLLASHTLELFQLAPLILSSTLLFGLTLWIDFCVLNLTPKYLYLLFFIKKNFFMKKKKRERMKCNEYNYHCWCIFRPNSMAGGIFFSCFFLLLFLHLCIYEKFYSSFLHTIFFCSLIKCMIYEW